MAPEKDHLFDHQPQLQDRLQVQLQNQLQALCQQLQASLAGSTIALVEDDQSPVTQDPVTQDPVTQDKLAQIQQGFQQSFTSLNLLDETIQAQIHPIQIEITKQLRLLETDAVFLKAARQPTTVAQRQQQIQQRLELLLKYCEAVLPILRQAP